LKFAPQATQKYLLKSNTYNKHAVGSLFRVSQSHFLPAARAGEREMARILRNPVHHSAPRGEIMRNQNGFTLIEIAIVLVIIGLLLGGVLKGQELIQSARVRNLIAQQDGVKAAYFGFLDRYRALPGDYGQAQANIPGCGSCQQGNNNGQITESGTAGATIHEHISAWEHLSKAGFITGSYVAGGATPAASTLNTPSNPFGSLVQLIFDGAYQDGASATGSNRHNLKTGNNISSDLLAEVDRKIDDGLANAGQFRFSTFNGASNASDACFNSSTGAWQSASPNANCGAATLF
jgi:prepilin-type N-terminal cleavage/methylation domain-containing protein